MTRCTVPLLSAHMGRQMKRIYRTAEPCAFKFLIDDEGSVFVPDTDYNRFCEELVSADEALVAAFVVLDGIRGSHIKLDVPVLKEEDAKRISKQTDTVMGIIKSNEHLFGQLGYVLVHHESVDGMFFPIDDSLTVLVGLIKPYDPDKIEQAVRLKAKAGLTKRTIDST